MAPIHSTSSASRSGELSYQPPLRAQQLPVSRPAERSQLHAGARLIEGKTRQRTALRLRRHARGGHSSADGAAASGLPASAQVGEVGCQQRPAALLDAETERHRPQAAACRLERRIVVGDQLQSRRQQQPGQRALAGTAEAAQQCGAAGAGDRRPRAARPATRARDGSRARAGATASLRAIISSSVVSRCRRPSRRAGSAAPARHCSRQRRSLPDRRRPRQASRDRRHHAGKPRRPDAQPHRLRPNRHTTSSVGCVPTRDGARQSGSPAAAARPTPKARAHDLPQRLGCSRARLPPPPHAAASAWSARPAAQALEDRPRGRIDHRDGAAGRGRGPAPCRRAERFQSRKDHLDHARPAGRMAACAKKGAGAPPRPESPLQATRISRKNRSRHRHRRRRPPPTAATAARAAAIRRRRRGRNCRRDWQSPLREKPPASL